MIRPTKQANFIDGKWTEGTGPLFQSINPATQQRVWQGHASTQEDVDHAVEAAKKAFPLWSQLPHTKRIDYLNAFHASLLSHQTEFATMLSEETGKSLKESHAEISAMLGKIAISIEAYDIRCPEENKPHSLGRLRLRHRPHGVMVVLGPFNVPGHIPNGQIVPALLAGNTIVFKPSEYTPAIAELMVEYWNEIGLPHGVLNMTHGMADTGKALAAHPDIDGLLFVGSWNTGKLLAQQFAATPYKILALEMGGNNPLVVGTLKERKAAITTIIQSAYLTSGQRCTCARRLIVQRGNDGNALVTELIAATQALLVGAYTDTPEPFIGPVISKEAASNLIAKQQHLIEMGATPLLPMKQLEKGAAFLSPGIIDVTDVKNRQDEEVFGPLLQLIWVDDLPQAIEEANNTAYGLTAGILSDSQEEYQEFYNRIRAGIINWNAPLTGVSSTVPFGGLGHSGNQRPSAFYAADYCAYPVASIEGA